jgi:hypothetical protein
MSWEEKKVKEKRRLTFMCQEIFPLTLKGAAGFEKGRSFSSFSLFLHQPPPEFSSPNQMVWYFQLRQKRMSGK